VTLAFMPAWIVQWNPCVPAAAKTRVWDPVLKSPMSPVPSPAAAAVLPAASSQVTLWETPDWFCHVTVDPTATVRVAGEKLLDPMQKVLAGHVGGGGGGVTIPPSPPPPPQDRALNAKTRAPDKPEIFRILSPRRAESNCTASDRFVARVGTIRSNKQPVRGARKESPATV
jgi:hypothetical protein